MKKFLMAMLVMTLALVFTACGNGGGGAVTPTDTADTAANGADGPSGTIVHWVWNDWDELGSYRFHDYFPNINIEYQIVPSGEIVARFQTTIAAGGELPDVLNVEMDARAMLFSLDNVFHVLDDAPFNIDRSLLVDFAIPLMSNPAGEILGVQIDNCVGGVLFKRDLALEFFGTDDPDELGAMLQTPADYVYWAAQVNAQSGGTVQMFAGAGDAFRVFGSLGVANSAPVVINNYQLNVRNIWMEAFETMEGLIAYNGFSDMAGWSPAWFASFSGDNVIFFPGPTWFISVLVKPNDEYGEGNWGMISPPGGSFSWGGTAYAIPLGAREPELAWEFIRWFTMTQSGAESFFSAHQTPSLYRPAYDTDLFANNPDPFFAGQDVIAKLLEIAAHPDTQTRPISIFDGTALSAMGPVWIEMMENGLSAADAMTMLEDEMIFVDDRLHR